YRKVQTRSYYGADDKLRVQQGYNETGVNFTGERRGYFSEYRYDALGRRVLVRTRRDGLCSTSQGNVDCTSGIERYVWAGDNILWELRGPGASTETADRLEQESAVPQEYGIVGYTHAGGVDRPLVAYKTLGGNAGAVVVPHMNWRGLFSMGTNSAGGASTTPVEWPGFRTTANHSMGETQAITKNWMGSLLEGQRDAGGQMYMRNRYYDPATGQFTQTDPIGIAGGLNTYGFAAGDPVTYSDPYGLCPESAGGDGKTESYADCPEGTTGYHAYLDSQGQGGAMNTVRGVVAACREETACKVGGVALLLYGAWVASGPLATWLGGSSAAAEAAPAAAAAVGGTIQFGRVANQVSHTFRHVVDMGLDPEEVRAAVLQHLPTVANQLQPGVTLNQIVTVAGTRLQYSAHLLANGVINVGRIHQAP
ncbi:MAG TPA: RHS repeat-associated core domain-containing protein, partial [Longimicrobium sp.]|nr:RHS repeat-associated core domain-containing protein [Longimicrobium sp.]